MGPDLGIQEVVARVKEAIASAMAGGDPAGPVLERVDLTVKTVVKRSAGLDVSVTVPVIDVKLGIGGDMKEQETRSVSLTLIPEPPGTGRFPRVFADEVVAELSSAVVSVRDALRTAALGEPRFALKKATAQLTFLVDSSGNLSLLGKRGTESGTAHTVELVFGPSSPGMSR
jgi:hypothetical protein